MPIPFELVMTGAPVSNQTRRGRQRRQRRRDWIQEVQQAAKQEWGTERPHDRAVAVTITYFYDGRSPDVDNVPKPILDALKGIVYHDDRQVSDLFCRKRELGDLLIRNPSAAVLESLGDGKPFLHIGVAEAVTREIEM